MKRSGKKRSGSWSKVPYSHKKSYPGSTPWQNYDLYGKKFKKAKK